MTRKEVVYAEFQAIRYAEYHILDCMNNGLVWK